MCHIKTSYYLSVVFAIVFSSFACAGSVSFYVVAHEDDWQLFMNPNAFDDVNSAWNDKTVFIYLTAGDAGNRINNTYYSAREDGANRSVRFMADAASAGSTSTTSTVTINGNSIRKVVYKDTVSYFLRLPDGGEGNGYTANGNQSLAKLYSGQISAITNITGVVASPTSSNTYYGWSELVATLYQIVKLQGVSFNQVFVNLPDPTVAPDDHSDHTHTGLAMQDAMNMLPCVTKVYFTHNPTGMMAINESMEQMINEAATWGAMTTGLTERGYNSTYDGIHKLAIGKNYFRTETGSGNCTF